jgi:arylsulfatase A-like enzyme
VRRLGRAFRQVACCALALLSLTLAGISAAAPERFPNIVFILADDMGYGDCGACNPDSKIPTPQIDRLASEGLLFTDAHAAAGTCTPSRYGLLTGINPLRTGVRNTLLRRGCPIIAADEGTVAALLRDHGYLTRMVGKWHLGFDKASDGQRPVFDFSKPLQGGPLDCGFESFFGMHSSPGAQPLCFIRNRRVVAEPTAQLSFVLRESRGKPVEVTASASPGFSLEEAAPAFCREALQIIREHAATRGDQPFFLYYASPIPHTPWVPSAEFRGRSGLGAYADFVMQLDDVVGQLNDVLVETGLDRDTLLIFSSDNGPGPGAAEAMGHAGHASAGILRGGKSDAWEGGHRVPFIVKWPGRVPAGSVSSATINFTDFFATVAELLGVDAAAGQTSAALDSHSFYPVLLDPAAVHQRPAMVHGFYAVRHGDWKLAAEARQSEPGELEPADFQLFNLRDDPGERSDLSGSEPERVASLFAEFAGFIDQRVPK